MSRKSRLTLWKEKLEKISKCPFDLFDKVEPDEEMFSEIEKSEDGNISCIRKLTEHLYSVYKDDDELNGALYYYANLGLSQRDEVCATVMLKCITSYNEHFDDLDAVLRILESENTDENIDRLITLAKVKRIIKSASDGADYSELTRTLSQMYDEYSAYARIYLAAQMLRHTGEYDKDKIDSLAEALDIPFLVTLPVFVGEASLESNDLTESSEEECESMRFALALIDMDEWRDFWLRAIYEYSQFYLRKNILPFAKDMYRALNARCNYPKKKIHMLSLLWYMCDNGIEEYRDEYESLYKECLFEGAKIDLGTDSERDELIREAIYTCGSDEREKARMTAKLGSEIIHTKNRYSLKTTLSNHQKRGNKHLWEITISIKTGSQNLPIINPVPIAERNNEVIRCGIALDKEKKLSQIICRGEIQIGERVHPLELDLILDISYVSSTKCELCEIKIKDHRREGEHIVMDSILSLY